MHGTLSMEDLLRWRNICANKELVDLNFNGMSVEEARRTIIEHYQFCYNVQKDMAIEANVPFIISAVDGSVSIAIGADD